jgi:nitrogenase molybdenum-iron protein NifN
MKDPTGNTMNTPSTLPIASFTAARNTCKLCAPLGACLALRGVEGCIPVLHGSQGCATYIRRYMISHFKEPMDIASSNFGEISAIYGGKNNLRQALENVVNQYHPKLVGIATTCLAETIGDDVRHYLNPMREELGANAPELVHISTPSYAGTHSEGFRATLAALVLTLAKSGPTHSAVNVICGMASPADLRYLKTIFRDFGLEAILLPDYSDTLDGPAWAEYQVISPGGTPLDSIRRMGSARATIEFADVGPRETTAGTILEDQFHVPCHRLSLPMGVVQTDELFKILETLSGRPTPEEHRNERGRLVDAYVDAHKYVFGKRAIVYGEPDLVLGIVSLLAEIGMVPVLCATGSKKTGLAESIGSLNNSAKADTIVHENADFEEIEELASTVSADIVIGNSKGYKLARRLGVPIVRVGFPIHDRIDGPRILHLGYRGAQQLFDRITNVLIGAAQDASPVGYSYM